METQNQKFDPKVTPSEQMKDFTEFADKQSQEMSDQIDAGNDFARSVGVKTSNTNNETQELQEAITEEEPTKKKYDMKKRVAAGVAGTAALVATGAAIDARLDSDRTFNSGQDSHETQESDTATLPDGTEIEIDDTKYQAEQGVPENPADMIVNVEETPKE